MPITIRCLTFAHASIAFLLATAMSAPALGSEGPLHALFRDYWEAQMRNFPTWATYLGDHRYDDRLTDHSAGAYESRRKELQGFRARLEAIPLAGLSSADSLNHVLFARVLEDALDGAQFRSFLMPITQQGGPPSQFAELPTYHPQRTVEDIENYISRLHTFPILVDQVMANMHTGMEQGLMPARITMAKVLPQLDALIVRDPATSILATPVDSLPETIPAPEGTRLAKAIHLAIRDQVVPAYRKLRDYIRDRYLRACRPEPGIGSLPDGQARYAYAIRHYTTTNMTPAEIHELGRRELGHTRVGIRSVINRLGQRGTIRRFMDALRANPRFYHHSADSLMADFRIICKTIDARLPRLFGRLPQSWYDLREIEAFRAPSAPAAYYYGAPDDASRPAYFYVNTYRPETRPKYTMEVLAYHEAVPGHHLQLTLQQELKGLPDFRRHGGFTAFVEGWALYAERLPKEVGLYADPYSEFGRLTFESWRAVRLIVDTGIHHFKWTREEAIEFLREHTALAENDIVSEVERYIAWPGQALAYKIGQMKIANLRLQAEQRLGDRFDIRRFHDALLEEGALPLDLLEIKMERWLNVEDAANRPPLEGR
jgi:uncharacterized protein (DUF885 family)